MTNKAEIKRLNRVAPSILSADLVVKGQIYSSGDVQLDGVLEGNICSHAVTIGESARILGEISGEIVTIRGQVDGTIRARRVHLCAGSRVNGDIYHEALAIESGAELNGAVKREKDPLADAAIKPDQFTARLERNT